MDNVMSMIRCSEVHLMELEEHFRENPLEGEMTISDRYGEESHETEQEFVMGQLREVLYELKEVRKTFESMKDMIGNYKW